MAEQNTESLRGLVQGLLEDTHVVAYSLKELLLKLLQMKMYLSLLVATP